MRLKRLSSKDELIKEVKKLYAGAFPQDERMPFGMLVGMMDEHHRLYALMEEDTLIGFVYLYQNTDTFLYYFAVAEEYRGKGYGTETLRLIRQLDGVENIALDIEEVKDNPAENDAALKRRNFYLNAGFHTTEIRYHFFGVDYEIMASKEGYAKDEYMKLAEKIWGNHAALIRYH